MFIGIALGSLAQDPPAWIQAKITAADVSMINAAPTLRRRRELAWSRGMKSELLEYQPQLEINRACNRVRPGNAPPEQVSITHDRHHVAVAIAQSGNIGIDLQSDRPLASCRRIADSWFPRRESAEIIQAVNCERFMMSWVVKESWAKCFNRSIFEACHTVGIWSGAVHIKGNAHGSVRFAWARTRLVGELNDARNLGLTMGLCWAGSIQDVPAIECFAPCRNPGLQRYAVNWVWIPVLLKSAENEST